MHAAVIGRVFAEGELAVQMDAIHWSEGGILLDETFGALLKFGGIFRGPPIAQVTLGIELAALIVEPVRQLVPHYRTDGATVHGRIHAVVEEGRLQNARREVDVVL